MKLDFFLTEDDTVIISNLERGGEIEISDLDI